MAQTWRSLLFAHWPVDPEVLRPVMPEVLEPDTFDGTAWIAVTPFWIEGFRLRGMPPLPWISRFPEVNVRTYVTVDGKRGIWFFSLDAASRFAVRSARRIYRLPYFRAEMSVHAELGEVRYGGRRVSHDGPPAQVRVDYRPIGPAAQPAASSLEHWLVERYCLYVLDEQQRLLRGEIQHPPWLISEAEATFVTNTMTEQIGVELAGWPLLHYAERQDVVFWRIKPIPADG